MSIKWNGDIKTDRIYIMKEGLKWVDLCEGKDSCEHSTKILFTQNMENF